MSGGEWHVEMLWRCASCDEKNLGRNTSCQRCGKPKTGKEEYVMPDDTAQSAAVSDPELLRLATAGANWRCQFCGSDQRRFDGECAQCGAAREQGKDLGAEPPPAPPQAPAVAAAGVSSPRRQLLLTLGITFGGLFVASLGLFLCARSPAPPPPPITQVATAQAPPEPAFRDVSAALASISWEHTVTVERYKLLPGEGFDRPADATDVKKVGQRVHHTDKVQDGTTTETYTETVPDGYRSETYSEREPCGEDCTTTPQTCRNECKSGKNGFATCKNVCSGGGRRCTTKYCDRSKTRQVPRTKVVTRTRQIPRYKDVPRYQDWYTWKAWGWTHDRDIKASGTTAETRWPADAEIKLQKGEIKGEKEREVRSGRYRISFAEDGGTTHTVEPSSLDEFSRLAKVPRATLRIEHGRARVLD